MQNDLLSLNEWSKINNMRFNGEKFFALCMGPDNDLKNTTNYFSGNFTEVIEQVDTCRDLGVEMSADMTFSAQIKKAISKATQKAGWILRTFRSRSPGLLRTLWRSLVEPHLDYCSQLWSPAKTLEIDSLEAPLRAFSKNVRGAEGRSYWERLKLLKLSSVQRRHDRYKIIYCYKIINGLVPNPGLNLNPGSRRGPLITGGRARKGFSDRFDTLKAASFLVSGPKLFNCLPRSVREHASVDKNGKLFGLEIFKTVLDLYLSTLPDQPFSNSTGHAHATFNNGGASNSVLAHTRIRPQDDQGWKAPCLGLAPPMVTESPTNDPLLTGRGESIRLTQPTNPGPPVNELGLGDDDRHLHVIVSLVP